ncbi:rhomboid family intramembrane serine protease [Polaribacter sp.]|jgi:membrane associated rhomboid family serine protease|uniref:rhomboid family intramembrane serine protease n=1 Tax=Polaribacter sp. TaxID=1920175 RepID=UPI004048B92A
MNNLKNLKSKFDSGTIVEKLIYINIFIFLFTLFISVFQNLFKNDSNFLIQWFSLDASTDSLITKPWSLISYGFLHESFIHIIFNLIALYFIGNLFIDYFTQKQLFTFYLLGTFFGGLFYLFSQNYFPLFEGKTTTLIGASAGISTIFIGISTYMPNFELKIRFIGFVKLWYLAAIWVSLDVLGLTGENAGGHFAHLGGSIFGFLYINKVRNRKFNIFKKLFSIFSPKNKPLKTVYKSTNNTKKNSNTKDFTQKKIDIILDKISKSGYDTLTKEEKEILFKQGKN